MSQWISTVGDEDFEAQVLQASQPVLVDFWAPWCGPCMAMMDTLDQVAEEYQGRVTVCKFNVDEHYDVPSRYSVRSIPFLVLFDQGKLVQSSVGKVAKAQLKEMIDGHLVQREEKKD